MWVLKYCSGVGLEEWRKIMNAVIQESLNTAGFVHVCCLFCTKEGCCAVGSICHWVGKPVVWRHIVSVVFIPHGGRLQINCRENYLLAVEYITYRAPWLIQNVWNCCKSQSACSVTQADNKCLYSTAGKTDKAATLTSEQETLNIITLLYFRSQRSWPSINSKISQESRRYAVAQLVAQSYQPKGRGFHSR